jgi:hypothetical protein
MILQNVHQKYAITRNVRTIKKPAARIERTAGNKPQKTKPKFN